MFDYITITILLFSCLIAVWRGFLKEIFSFSGWVFAAACTIYFLPYAINELEGKMSSPFFVKLFALSGLFICFSLAFLLVNTIVLNFIKLEGVSLPNRVLGLFFGLLRGTVIISLFYIVLSSVMSQEKFPSWYTEAKAYEFSKQGGKILIEMGVGDKLE